MGWMSNWLLAYGRGWTVQSQCINIEESSHRHLNKPSQIYFTRLKRDFRAWTRQPCHPLPQYHVYRPVSSQSAPAPCLPKFRYFPTRWPCGCWHWQWGIGESHPVIPNPCFKCFCSISSMHKHIVSNLMFMLKEILHLRHGVFDREKHHSEAFTVHRAP